MADDPLTSIYMADRADGSAIYQANMNLLYVITTYGALVAAAVSTSFVTNSWALAFIGAPLWGLLCYQLQLLVLASVRVNSIKILEEKLLARIEEAELSGTEKNQIGSDAGDRISRVSHQPTSLKPANFAAFGAVAVATAALAITSLNLVEPKCSLAFLFGLLVHGALAGAALAGAISLWRIKKLILALGEEGPYYSAESARRLERHQEDGTPRSAGNKD